LGLCFAFVAATACGRDDSIKARGIDVTTNDGVVITGSVRSQAEHDRAMALARDTEGVTRVVDHLEIR
jgi:hyperosmotically inducible periplasmic protein